MKRCKGILMSQVMPHRKKSSDDESRASDEFLASLSDSEESSKVSGPGGDRVAFEPLIDELDDESESEALLENLEHLRDIVGRDLIAPGSDSESDVEIFLPDRSDLENTEDETAPKFKSWSWDQTPTERTRTGRKFLRLTLSLIHQLTIKSEKLVDAARRDVQEAAAIGFKRARIIGAAAVRATRRL